MTRWTFLASFATSRHRGGVRRTAVASHAVPRDVVLAAAQRNYLPYGRISSIRVSTPAAIVAFERAARPTRTRPRSIGSAHCCRRWRRRARSSGVRARARVEPDLAELNNDLGALLAQSGDLQAAIARFRAALATAPETPMR